LFWVNKIGLIFCQSCKHFEFFWGSGWRLIFFVFSLRHLIYLLFILCDRLRLLSMLVKHDLLSLYYLHAGWLDCPSSGQEIFGMIPSKVPLGESFNDYILPGKRYSFKQVIHQLRLLGRKVSRMCFLFFFI